MPDESLQRLLLIPGCDDNRDERPVCSESVAEASHPHGKAQNDSTIEYGGTKYGYFDSAEKGHRTR